MEIPLVSKITRSKYGIPFLVIATGIFYGVLLKLLFTSLKPTYATFLIAGSITPFIIVFLGNTKHFFWIVLLCLLPITVDFTINHTGHLGGAAGWIVSALDIVLAVLYFLWIIEMVQKRSISIRIIPEISIPALLLIGSAAISAINAKHPELSIYEIVEIIKMYLLFLYLANNIKTDRDVRLIIHVFIFSLLFEGVLGWLQHRFDEPIFPSSLGGPTSIDSRVCGTWQSFNDFSWYLTFFLPIALSQLFSNWSYSYKYLCFGALASGSAALAWTSGRSGWISFAIAAIMVLFFCFTKLKNKKRIITTFIVTVTIIVVLVPLYPRLFSKVYGRFAGDDRGSTDSRWPQFEMALDIMEDHLLVGAGINNYTEIMDEYDNTEEGIFELTHHQVHNIFLQICAEMGLFGISAFLLLLSSIFYNGLKFIIHNSNVDAYLIIGMLAGILAFLLHGLFDALSLGGKMFSFVWAFTGIIAGIKYKNHYI